MQFLNKINFRKTMTITATAILFIALSSFLLGCEADEDNAILQAQECFNHVDDSTAVGAASDAVAAGCVAYLGASSSPKANLLRCGIEFWRGGLRTTTLVTAFDNQKLAPANEKEATLIKDLGLSSNAVADTAYNYCKSANAPGMFYIAGLVRLGTYMQTANAGNGTAAAIIAACQGDGTCNSAAMGEMLIDIGSAYCVGESATSDVCVAMNTAILANPGNPAAVINSFLTQITP